MRATNPALGCFLDEVFDSLPEVGVEDEVYSFLDRGERARSRYVLYRDRERLSLSPSGRFILSTLLWDINREAVAKSNNYLVLHAGAVEHDGAALLFPAPMESGKTTLVAGLIRAGLRYLTDEAAAIDMTSGQVQPFPKPLTIDVGSWATLPELSPVVEPGVEHDYLRSQWHVDARKIRPDALAPAATPSFVITPRYERGGATELVSMSRPDALVALCQNSFNLARHGAAGMELLARIVSQMACYRLSIGELQPACELVLDLLSSEGLD